MRTAHLTIAVAVLACTACEYRPYEQPPPRQPSTVRTSYGPASVADESALTPAAPSKTGYLFFFRRPPPSGWKIIETTDSAGPDASTSPLCMAVKDDRTKILFMLRSYVDGRETIGAFQNRIIGNAQGWISSLPAEYRTPPVTDKDGGYVAVGIPGDLDSRWLIVAGRWPANEQEQGVQTVKELFSSIAVAKTSASFENDPNKHRCAHYF